MSTHTLDASGARPLTTTTNDPARTAATVQAKSGDDVVVTLGAFDYVEIPIPQTPGACEIVVRRKTVRKMKRDEQGNEVRDENRNVVYEDVEEETRTLRLSSYVYVSAHTLKEKDYPTTPHTTFRIVNLEKEPNQPVWLQGQVTSEAKVDLGYGAGDDQE